jgi:hypothetical protein
VCNGGNPGCVRNAGFTSVYPLGLRVGCPLIGNAVIFTSSAAVETTLPIGGPASVLTTSVIDPGSSAPGGVLLGQLTAALLNLGFNAAGRLGACQLATLCVAPSCAVAACRGRTVHDVIAAAQTRLGGNCVPSCAATLPALGTLCTVGLSDIVSCLDTINKAFDNGVSTGKLAACAP